MKALSISEIAAATGAELIGADDGRMVTAISTDTRNLPQGCLFVALRGENFDGHAFAAEAVEKGVGCLMLDKVSDEVRALGVPVIQVKNTLYGLQRLAMWYRQRLNIKVVGITGSNGKTSTKDFTSSVLSQQFQVNATVGNLNNHIGVPLTIFACEEDDEICVCEMGMNHAGEIAPLCEIAAPEIGIITNIGTAHIENLGTREGIAEEKGALARALSEQGALIVPASCDFVDYLIGRTVAKVMVVGNGRGVVRAENLHMDADGSSFNLCIDGQEEIPTRIQVNGVHMVNNALLAAAAGYALGMSTEKISAGLTRAVLTSGRLRRFQKNGITIIDDTYNANPESVAAAIDTLADLKDANGGRRVVVLGMMAELGPHADKAHIGVGKRAAERHLQVVSVGEEAEKIHQGASEVDASAKHFAQHADAAEWIKDYCREGDMILFKGSRMAGMERVMNKAFP